MTTIQSILDQILGTVPSYATAQSPTEYYYIIRYMIAGVVLIMMLSLVYRMFIAIFGRWVR